MTIKAITTSLLAISLRMAHQASWPALLGGLLLIAAIATLYSATAPTRAQISAIDAQRKQLRLPSAKLAVPKAAPLSPREQLKAFYASFPARTKLPEALMQLHRGAVRNGLLDTRADYRDTPEAGTPLVRIKIEIPVSGSYAAIRTWIAEQLSAQATLTLDGLELRRADIAKPQLEARVRFQLLLRSVP